LPSTNELEAERLRRKLSEFVKAAWHLVEPATPLVWGWHLEAICQHLQAVTEGKIRKLIINIPPRTGKSTIVSVLWPAWEWARNPAVRIMFASYAQQLSLRDSVRRRLVILSEWFQARWPAVKLSSDQNVKHEFQNTALGYMVATSTGGTVTGRGGDRLVLDDPNDATQMESEVERESALTWFDLQWSTRGNNPNTYAEVIIQQRTHTQDITGHALAQSTWTHLKLPMEFAGERTATSIGWVDPRTQIGELLDAQRFSKETIESLKKRLGPYGASGQLQQEPSPSEGGIIKRAWIKSYTRTESHLSFVDERTSTPYHIPLEDCLRFATVDLAVSTKDIDKADPDYTVIASWCVFNTRRGVFLFLLDLFRERIEGPDIEQKIIERHEHWKYAIVALETIGFQLLIAQALIRKGIPVREMSTSLEAIYRLDKDKVARAYSATPLMADGRFFVPSYAPWVAEYIKELTVFPNYGHDDQVDVTSAAVSIADKIAGLSLVDLQAHVAKPPSYVASEATNNEVQEVTNQFGLSIARSPLSGYKFSKP
jgi:predicted phage terminase large subunit-like protein